MKEPLILVLFLMSLFATNAATWNGALSEDWNNPGNWSTGIVPISTETVNIVSGAANWPAVSTANAFCSSLNLAAGCSLSINNSFCLNAFGTLSITGNIQIGMGSLLNMANGKEIRVSEGGRLEALGASGNPATITSPDGYYSFSIEPGGTIAASFAIFEKLQVDGVNVHAGAFIDPAYPFSNCTFRNGISGGTLLTLNTSQNLLVTGAFFPANTWGGTSNVSKETAAGAVNFTDAAGTFSGESFDNDPIDRVIWTTPTPATDLRLIGAVWSKSAAALGQNVELTMTYVNVSTTSCNVFNTYIDWYPNQEAPPIIGQDNPYWFRIYPVPAGIPIDISFTVTTIDTADAGLWTSWVQIDSYGNVAESNETNNIYGPFYITWYELPAIDDLSIQYLQANNSIRLDWTYGHAVSVFNVYRGETFDFEPCTSNLVGTCGPGMTEFTEPLPGSRSFYVVKAAFASHKGMTIIPYQER